MNIKKIPVKASESYDVIIGGGLIKNCAGYIKTAVKAEKLAVITDDNVDKLYGNELKKTLEDNGFSVCKYAFPHGEASKCSETLNRIYDFLCENQITRTDCIIALGGGVVGDISGFAAATFLRGLDFIQMPTTLLAQVDSSIGGKTAINLPGGKNLAGAFKQPKLVICDTNALKTLSDELLTDGMGEVVKHGMIKSEQLFELLEKNDLKSIFNVIDDVIAQNVTIKRNVVEADEFDRGERMLLNFGHTLGHSIEKYYNFTGISHGKAVATGMKFITEIAERNNITQKGVTNRLISCLDRYGLNITVEPAVKDLAEACLNDKKRESGFISVIFCENVGKAFAEKMPVGEFLKLLR